MLATAEEVPETELPQLGTFQQRCQAQCVRQVVGTDLHGGFADLVRGNRRRQAVALQDDDGQSRGLPRELQRQGQPCQAAADDGHIKICAGIR